MGWVIVWCGWVGHVAVGWSAYKWHGSVWWDGVGYVGVGWVMQEWGWVMQGWGGSSRSGWVI